MNIIALHDIHYGFSERKTRKILENFFSKVAQKVEEFNVSAIIIAGDLSTSRQSEIKRLYKLIRSKINTPTLIVYGNHDYWDEKPPHPLKRPRDYFALRAEHAKLHSDFGISYLEEGSVTINGILFCGYDGWYRNISPRTRDLENMRTAIQGTPTHLFLNHRSHQEVGRVLIEARKHPDLVKVCVSHFDSFVREGDFESSFAGDHKQLDVISEKFDFVFFGHSHRHLNEIKNSARVICAGGDYDNPKGVVVRIPESKTDCKVLVDPVIQIF